VKNFSVLFRKLEEFSDQKLRIDFIINYFTVSTEEEITTATRFLSGNRPKKVIDISTLKSSIPKITSLPQWLVEESFVHSGDWAEVISLLIKPGEDRVNRSLSQWLGEIELFRNPGPKEKLEKVISALRSVSRDERYLLIKLFTGGTRLKLPTELLSHCRDYVSGVTINNDDNKLQKVNIKHRVTAVLLYVKFGRGIKIEYSFAAKTETGIVPFAKTESTGEADYDNEVLLFVKQNTIEKFGPVISIKPELVFELELGEIKRSSRHKCGLTVTSTRIIYLRHDLPNDQIVSLEHLHSLISE
jgi:hypothetical protein